jgi:hypothetical protein
VVDLVRLDARNHGVDHWLATAPRDAGEPADLIRRDWRRLSATEHSSPSLGISSGEADFLDFDWQDPAIPSQDIDLAALGQDVAGQGMGFAGQDAGSTGLWPEAIAQGDTGIDSHDLDYYIGDGSGLDLESESSSVLARSRAIEGLERPAWTAFAALGDLAVQLTTSGVKPAATVYTLRDIVRKVAGRQGQHGLGAAARLAGEIATAYGFAELFGVTGLLLSRNVDAKVLGGVLFDVLSMVEGPDDAMMARAEQVMRTFELLDEAGLVDRFLAAAVTQPTARAEFRSMVARMLAAQSSYDSVGRLVELVAEASAIIDQVAPAPEPAHGFRAVGTKPADRW